MLGYICWDHTQGVRGWEEVGVDLSWFESAMAEKLLEMDPSILMERV
jgi:hypothetical protein